MLGGSFGQSSRNRAIFHQLPMDFLDADPDEHFSAPEIGRAGILPNVSLPDQIRLEQNHNHNTMSGEQKTTAVAIALILFSLVSIVLLLTLTGGASLVPRAVRFVLTCVLSFFLFRGASWARWFAGISSALGAILSVVGWFGLASANVPMFSILGIWMVVMAIFYGWVAFMLLVDKDVSQHFNPRSGF